MYGLDVGYEIIMEEFTNDMMAGLKLCFKEGLVHGVNGVDNFIDFEHILFVSGFDCFGVFVHNIYL